MKLEQAFQAELSYLRDAGRTFAERHPALAGMLAERGTDPDVERLLQGFAFLSARLRARIDDAAPELCEALAEWLMPHAVRPVPAATMVAFEPRGLRAPLVIPRGARLHGRKPSRCTFTTCEPLTLLPVQLTRSELVDSARARPELRLALELDPLAPADALAAAPLRVHLHGEPVVTSQLMLWLARHVAGVEARGADGSRLELGPQCVVVPSPLLRAPLLPWPELSPPGLRTVMESFMLPARFESFELHGLSRAATLGRSWSLVLHFREPPPLAARLGEHALRLHCVPAVNLFSASAEPLRVDLSERPQVLRALGHTPATMEVFSVDRVIGVARDGQRRVYPPLHAFHDPVESGGFYRLTRRSADDEEGTHCWLSLQRPLRAAARGEETLSVELTCTNRALAAALQPGELCDPSTDVPAGVRFENLGAVAAPRNPPLASEHTWQLLAQLAVSRRSLADVAVLRQLLTLYATDPRSDDLRARSERARIAAIRSVRVRTVTRVFGGIASRGSLYELELDATPFASDGEAFAFGTTVHALLAHDARINSFADLVVAMVPSGRCFRYRAERAQ